MSKVLENVMGYANEDVASIRKHWFIFVKMGFRIFALLVFQIIVFAINNNLWLWELLVFLVVAGRDFLCTYLTYKNFLFSANNIQLKSQSGILTVRQEDIPIKDIKNVSTTISLFGRIFHYGSISVSAKGGSFNFDYVTEVNEFKEAVLLLQEAHKEGTQYRSDERRDETMMNHAMLNAKTMESLSQNITEAISMKPQQELLAGKMGYEMPRLANPSVE